MGLFAIRINIIWGAHFYGSQEHRNVNIFCAVGPVQFIVILIHFNVWFYSFLFTLYDKQFCTALGATWSQM